MSQLHEALIQKCTSITTLKKARQLHALVLTTTTITDNAQSPYLNNNFISMYARCGSPSDAQVVFDKMPHRNTVSFNALIAAYSRIQQRAISALQVFHQMESEGLRPNGSTCTSVLQACSSLEDRFMGKLCHAQVVKFGFFDDTRVQTSLLGMYSNCGDMEAAREVFSCINERDVVAWNSMIYGNLRNDNINEGFYLFSAMVRSGVSRNQFTYSMFLNACGRLGDYSCGRVIHAQLIVANVLADLPLQNALLDMYSSCGDMKTAFDVFDRMENTDLVSWNSIISGYSEHGEGEMAINLFLELLEMALPKPDEYTFAAIVSATSSFPASDYGKPLHAQIVKEGFEKSIFVGSTLVSMYFKSGDTESAQQVFNLISKKDVVIWTEMIVGHSRLAEGERAIKFFYDMCREGHKIDNFALSGVISACADLAILRQGEMIHSQAVKTGLAVDMFVCGSLVNMYAKNGDLPAAQSIFSQVPVPDLKCWNSMLGGYSYHGVAMEALKIFEEILSHGLKPDAVTFLSLLSACSYSGLVERGKFLWGYMKDNGLLPGPRHYSCMVCLLSRAGLVDEAEEMINESRFSADHLESWRTLLSSCVVNRNLQVGIRAAEEVLRLDSEDTATHVLLSNLFAVTGRWDYVAKMRKKIRKSMLGKDPGLSWIEAKNNVHVFSSGDQSHPEFDEAKTELHRLQSNMIKPITDELIQ